MPAFVKTPHDEELWAKAKARAAEEGHAEDYAYITGIFKRMKGGTIGKGELLLLVPAGDRLQKAAKPSGHKGYKRVDPRTGKTETIEAKGATKGKPSKKATVAAMAAELAAGKGKKAAAKPAAKAKAAPKPVEKPQPMHVATRDTSDQAHAAAEYMSKQKPGVPFYVGEKTVRRAGFNVPTYFVHEAAKSPHLFQHAVWVNGKKKIEPDEKPAAKPKKEVAKPKEKPAKATKKEPAKPAAKEKPAAKAKKPTAPAQGGDWLSDLLAQEEPKPAKPAKAAPEPEVTKEGGEDHIKQTFNIPAWNLSALSAHVAALNKRASKLGAKPIQLSTGAMSTKTHWKEYPDGAKVKMEIPMVEVSIEGTAPRIKGWRFMAKIEHVPGSKRNVVSTLPGVELPKKWQVQENHCDHCGHHRQRNNTYVLGKGSQLKQVGSSCMKDFTGHKEADALAHQLSFLDSSFGSFNDFSDPEFEGTGGHGPQRYDTRKYLAHVAMHARKDGYITSKMEDPYAGKVATARAALDTFRKDREGQQPSKEDYRTAHAAIAHVAELAKKGRLSDFENNLVASMGDAKEGLFHPKHAPIVAYAVEAERRHREDEARKKQIAKTGGGKHVGQVGERLRDVQAKLVSQRRMDGGQFGPTTLYKFVDGEGNNLSWFASGDQDLEDGKRYSLTGTVKAHKEFKGIPETQLTRAAVSAIAPTKEEAAAAHAARGKLSPTAKTLGAPIDPKLRGAKALDGLMEHWRAQTTAARNRHHDLDKPARDALEVMASWLWEPLDNDMDGVPAPIISTLRGMNASQLSQVAYIADADRHEIRKKGLGIGPWLKANADTLSAIAGKKLAKALRVFVKVA